MTANQATTQRPLRALLEENHEGLLTCVHCGLCLPSCPTYRVLGNENDSPRGRIYLMRAVVEGRIEASDSFTSHIDLCLGCRACESVCPSGVPYGQLLESARAEVAEIQKGRRSVTALATSFVLNTLFTRPLLLRFAMAVTRWIRDSGLARLAFDSELVTGRLRLALALLLATRPEGIGAASASSPLNGQPNSQKPAGEAIKVALLLGCVMEGLFTSTNRSTERILLHNGCSVVDAPGQACCGALHAHAGEIEAARRLARRNVDAFLDSGVDRVIVNAAGCGAAMKEYGHLLKDDPEYRDRARQVSSMVRDISEIFSEREMVAPAKAVPRTVAYDAPCHLMHAQKVIGPPVEMLRSVPGLRLAPLPGSENCCGGAGIYNLLHQELSAEILSAKISSILSSGAEIVATGNPGCIMQIGAGLLLAGSDIRVMHPADLAGATDDLA
jgi:glycolate oxidase iron-sulfur subunit